MATVQKIAAWSRVTRSRSAAPSSDPAGQGPEPDARAADHDGQGAAAVDVVDGGIGVRGEMRGIPGLLGREHVEEVMANAALFLSGGFGRTDVEPSIEIGRAHV